MVGLIILLLVAFSFDWAKNCKPVNYKYTQYKNKERYGSGCKKGCFGYANDSTGVINLNGEKFDGDHTVQDTCVECKTITKDFLIKIVDEYTCSGNPRCWVDPLKDEYVELTCNGEGVQINYVVEGYFCGGGYLCNQTYSIQNSFTQGQCFWNSKKKTCGAGSCPQQAAFASCPHWKDGKCQKDYDLCSAGIVSSIGSVYNTSSSSWLDPGCDGQRYDYLSDPVTCNNMTNYYYRAGEDVAKGCYVYKKITADQQKECKYKCEHRNGVLYTPFEFSKDDRKFCHKVLGCMYSAGDTSSRCSYLAVWAFVLILVIVILVGLGIIALVCFLIFKLCCGNKSTKVDPSAAPAPAAKSAPQAAPAAAAPATQAPPPEVGPYMVIKLGKQELKTKKVESAVWGQSIVFTGLGPEDDDVIFELRDNSDALLGSTDVRIPDYVNAKKRATINLKNGEEVIGVLEADIEIQVQEEPEVKITGVFFIDKFTKPI